MGHGGRPIVYFDSTDIGTIESRVFCNDCTFPCSVFYTFWTGLT